jgi:tetratricopeptide (TPR) repeat protein
MVALTTLNCPVCGAPMQDASARCVYCGSLVVIRMDHPRLDPALLDRARVDQQITSLRARIRRDPADAEAHYGLGVAYFSLGLLDDSAEELAVAVSLAPEHPEIRVQLAVVLAELDILGRPGAKARAWKEIRTALSLDRRNAQALLLSARLLTATGDWDGAMDTLRPALRTNPEIDRGATDLLLGRATMLAARGRWADASTHWTEAAGIDPETTRDMLLDLLQRNRETLAAPPKWSWVTQPPERLDFAGLLRGGWFILWPGFAAFVATVIFAQWQATMIISLIAMLLIIILPIWRFFELRAKRRAQAVPHDDLAEAIRRDPDAFLRGNPSLDLVLKAAGFVATERQGQAIVAERAVRAGGERLTDIP